MASLPPIGIYAPVTQERIFIRDIVQEYRDPSLLWSPESKRVYIDNNILLLDAKDIELGTDLLASDFGVNVIGESINFRSRVAVVACTVNLFAKERITLGSPREDVNTPFRLYAPHMLTISAEELQIGNVAFLDIPKAAMISCRKVTVLENYREEFKVLELVKQWLAKPDIPIEVQKALV